MAISRAKQVPLDFQRADPNIKSLEHHLKLQLVPTFNCEGANADADSWLSVCVCRAHHILPGLTALTCAVPIFGEVFTCSDLQASFAFRCKR